jgi:hypothetical protein
MDSVSSSQRRASLRRGLNAAEISASATIGKTRADWTFRSIVERRFPDRMCDDMAGVDLIELQSFDIENNL